MNEIGQVCAPTFPRSFLCSVAFAGHVMGAESALAVLESKRLTGAAASSSTQTSTEVTTDCSPDQDS